MRRCGTQLDQSRRREVLERLAHGRARDPEPATDALLVEADAGRELAFEDFTLERRRDERAAGAPRFGLQRKGIEGWHGLRDSSSPVEPGNGAPAGCGN